MDIVRAYWVLHLMVNVWGTFHLECIQAATLALPNVSSAYMFLCHPVWTKALVFGTPYSESTTQYQNLTGSLCS